MAVLDEQGRFFGRINLIDALVAFFVLALLPLTYGAWVLFRAPTPVVESVTPVEIVEDQPNQEIRVQGRYLRPFLRAAIGSERATYLFDTPEQAIVKLPPLPPGTYDLGIYDTKELARFPNVIKVHARELVELRVLARFVTRPEVMEIVKRASEKPVAPVAPGKESSPVLVSYEVTNVPQGTSPSELREGPVSVVRAVVRLMAVRTPTGWQFEGGQVKAGASFELKADTYVLTGVILSFDVFDPTGKALHGGS